MDNVTRSYSLVIKYRNRQKVIFNGSVINMFTTCRQLESKNTNVVMLFLFQTQHRNPLQEAFFYYICMLIS